MVSNARETLEQTLNLCTECQACLCVCQFLKDLGGLTPCDVAEQVLSGQVDEEVGNYILRCDLCGLCTQYCPEECDIPVMVVAARQILLENGTTDPELYRAVWMDHDWNAFSIYRDMYNVDYSDLIKTRCDTLFFPGCALSSYAPGLTRAAVGWLAEQSGEAGLSLMCCGMPLTQIGLRERAERHMKLLWQMVGDMEVHRVVTACPNCHYQLLKSEVPEGVKVISLFQLMADAGVCALGFGSGKIAIHDSCPDRKGEISKCVRQMLSNYEIIEMAHHGAESICCGSGGIVSMVDSELCTQRAEVRLKEFYDVGADICVTYCMACVERLARTAEPGKIRYLLELIFNQSVDHAQNIARAEAMWQGDWGEYNSYRLKNSRIREP